MFENLEIPENLRPSDPRFGSGPSLVPAEFVKSLWETGPHYLGTSHRKAPVKKVVAEVQEGLRNYFQLPKDYEVVIGNGGATFLFDAIALGIVEKRATHHVCGEFSSKWFKASRDVPWIETIERSVEFGQGLTPEGDPESDLIAVTLNETSTGVIAPSLPKVDDKTILSVDATSGGGQVPCDVSKTDLFFLSPQKVLAGEGGTWFAIMSPKAIERALRISEDKDRYIPTIMSWKLAIENSRKNQTYNTPSLSTLWYVNEQMKKMNREGGYQKIIEDCWNKANHVYSWADSKEYLSPYIKEEKYRSNAVATIDVDDKVDVAALLKKLEDMKLVYGIDAYRKLGRNQFRIALFHNIKHDDLVKLTGLLSHSIESAL